MRTCLSFNEGILLSVSSYGRSLRLNGFSIPGAALSEHYVLAKFTQTSEIRVALLVECVESLSTDGARHFRLGAEGGDCCMSTTRMAFARLFRRSASLSGENLRSFTKVEVTWISVAGVSAIRYIGFNWHYKAQRQSTWRRWCDPASFRYRS